jgi:hypothetical protein
VFSMTVTAAFDDLDVLIGGGGDPLTNEQAKQVSGDVTDSRLHLESKWQFTAAIP